MKIESRFSDIFSELKDHRMNRTKLHSLENIMFISLAAVISGAETWNEIEEFGNEKIDWLTKYLDMPNGVPSHDTFNRFFSTMDPDKFEAVFRKWVATIQRETHGDVVSIDGKSIRGSRKGSLHAVHIVSAWSKNAGITLGQMPTTQKIGELTIIPQLLDALFIEGSIVTIDALGAQLNIAEKIVEKGADYVLQVKNNRKQMVRDIEFTFNNLPAHSMHEIIEKNHGREEKRRVYVIHDVDLLRNYKQWTNLNSIIKVESHSKNLSTGKVESNTAYYISSLDTDAKHIGSAIRSHWGIENSLHWMLDVAFSEDRGRKQNKNAVINFSLINKIALEMLRKEDSKKIGVKSRRLKSAWSTSYLEKVLGIKD